MVEFVYTFFNIFITSYQYYTCLYDYYATVNLHTPNKRYYKFKHFINMMMSAKFTLFQIFLFFVIIVKTKI